MIELYGKRGYVVNWLDTLIYICLNNDFWQRHSCLNNSTISSRYGNFCYCMCSSFIFFCSFPFKVLDSCYYSKYVYQYMYVYTHTNYTYIHSIINNQKVQLLNQFQFHRKKTNASNRLCDHVFLLHQLTIRVIFLSYYQLYTTSQILGFEVFSFSFRNMSPAGLKLYIDQQWYSLY